MATIITDKQERLQYIKEAAANAAAERRRVRELYETETEIADQFGMDTDFMSLEGVVGFVSNGIQKVSGGLRKMPVIIL